MTEHASYLKPKDYCGCGTESCTLFGTLKRPNPDGSACVRGCKCRRCIGRRNRKSGLAKQAKAAKALGVRTGKFVPSNEESWGGYFANEVKSGKQVGPVANWWRRVEAQVLANEPDHGSLRKPVRAVAMPEGMSDGLVVMRLSVWREHVAPALDEFYGAES